MQIGKFRQFLTDLSACSTSDFKFLENDLKNNGFSPNLVCVLILQRSALGLLMG